MIRPGRTLKFVSLAILTASLAASAPAPAAVPQTIAFQGFLTDKAAQPLQGTVGLDVAIYAEASGGTALWSESHSGTAVDRGVFAIVLGSVTPFGPAVARTSPRYLGVRVDGEPELPRTQLRATPFALRAQAADSVTAGVHIRKGSVSVLKTEFGPQGEMNLICRSEAGDLAAQLGAGTNGEGRLVLQSPGESVGLYSDYIGEPLLALNGNARSAVIELNRDSDISVRFPVGGINAVESFNEPGLAAANNTGTVALTATVASVLSRTITPPEDGYVLALGQCVARINHTNGTGTSGAVGLSDDGVAFGTAQDVNLQISTNAGSGSYSLPAHFNGVFPATADAPLTIHLVGSEASGVIDIEDVSLTLLYVPTSYGTVSATLLATDNGEKGAAQGTQSAAVIADEVAASRRANDDRIAAETAAQLAAHTARLAELEARLERLGSQDR
jgi:hypothetical protein